MKCIITKSAVPRIECPKIYIIRNLYLKKVSLKPSPYYISEVESTDE